MCHIDIHIDLQPEDSAAACASAITYALAAIEGAVGGEIAAGLGVDVGGPVALGLGAYGISKACKKAMKNKKK